MRSSIRVWKFMGIPIYLHFTFLLILPLVAWVFYDSTIAIWHFTLGFGAFENVSHKIFFAVLTALLFFFCVLLHELGHSYVALRHGINIKRITLLIFGGLAQLEESPRDPQTELNISLIGPLISILLGTASLVIFFALWLIQNYWVTYLRGLFGILAFYNIFIACFNMLPAFPMDGGRVLRAILATKMGYIDATTKAAAVGKAFALFLGIFGLWIAFYGGLGGLLLVIIAVVIYTGANEEERSTIAAVTLEPLSVSDVMTREVKTVSPSMSVNEFIDFMFRSKHIGFPVMDAVQRCVGIVTLHDVRKIAVEEREHTAVSQIMTRDVIAITPERHAVDALRLMLKHNIDRVLVIEDGTLKGLVSKTDLMRVIQILR